MLFMQNNASAQCSSTKKKNKKGKGHRGAQWCSQDIHTYTYIYKL